MIIDYHKRYKKCKQLPVLYLVHYNYGDLSSINSITTD